MDDDLVGVDDGWVFLLILFILFVAVVAGDWLMVGVVVESRFDLIVLDTGSAPVIVLGVSGESKGRVPTKELSSQHSRCEPRGELLRAGEMSPFSA